MLETLTIQVIMYLVTTMVGGLISLCVWLAKSLYRAKRDIDFAHCKLRQNAEIVAALTQRIDDMEDDIAAFQ